MSGRKEVLWAVAISAVLVTAGLLLSCGDDDGNGGAAVDCQAACEKLEECEWIPGFLGDDADECEEACEEELAEANEDLVEAFQCIPDTDCEDIVGNCFCRTVCEKLDECGMWEWDSMAACVYWCENDYYFGGIMCVLGFSSCQYIWNFCFY